MASGSGVTEIKCYNYLNGVKVQFIMAAVGILIVSTSHVHVLTAQTDSLRCKDLCPLGQDVGRLDQCLCWQVI